jgi:hypothetical protein
VVAADEHGEVEGSRVRIDLLVLVLVKMFAGSNEKLRNNIL